MARANAKHERTLRLYFIHGDSISPVPSTGTSRQSAPSRIPPAPPPPLIDSTAGAIAAAVISVILTILAIESCLSWLLEKTGWTRGLRRRSHSGTSIRPELPIAAMCHLIFHPSQALVCGLLWHSFVAFVTFVCGRLCQPFVVSVTCKHPTRRTRRTV